MFSVQYTDSFTFHLHYIYLVKTIPLSQKKFKEENLVISFLIFYNKAYSKYRWLLVWDLWPNILEESHVFVSANTQNLQKFLFGRSILSERKGVLVKDETLFFFSRIFLFMLFGKVKISERKKPPFLEIERICLLLLQASNIPWRIDFEIKFKLSWSFLWLF